MTDVRFTGTMQARREPQRGPGKHHRGALSPLPHSVCLEIEKASRGRKRVERCPLTIRLGVRGSVVSSPSGVRGRAPAENGFYAYFRSERSHLEHQFKYFWATAGPPKRHGARENFPPFPPSLDGPGTMSSYNLFTVARYPFGVCVRMTIGGKPSCWWLHSRGLRTESQLCHNRTVRVESILSPAS